MAREYKLTKKNAPAGADYITTDSVGMEGLGRVVLIKAEPRGWCAVRLEEWTSKGTVDGAAEGSGSTTDSAIVSLVDRLADRREADAMGANAPADGTDADTDNGADDSGIPGDVSESTPGNTDRVTAALEAAKRKVAAAQVDGAEGEGDTSAPAEPVKAAPVKAKRTRKEAVAAERERLAAQKSKREDSAPVVAEVRNESATVAPAEPDDHNRMTGEVQAAWESRNAPRVDVVAYAAGLIMNAYRKSAAQCSAAEGSQVPFSEAGERVRELIKSVEDAALESGSDAVMAMADDAVVIMGRHLGVITREGAYADVMVAKRAKNRLKRAAHRFHVSV